jgi:hypothetical protein
MKLLMAKVIHGKYTPCWLCTEENIICLVNWAGEIQDSLSVHPRSSVVADESVFNIVDLEEILKVKE